MITSRIDWDAVDRGINSLVEQALQQRADELLVLVSWGADTLADRIVQWCTRHGHSVKWARLETLSHASSEIPSEWLTGAACSVFLGAEGAPAAASMAVLAAAERAKSRHAHIVRAAPYLFETSMRADPALIERINQRVLRVIAGPSLIHITSEAGTDLYVGLEESTKLCAAAGRPGAGEAQNLPSGQVYFHPIGARGWYIADRNVVSAGTQFLAREMRRSPLAVGFEGGSVAAVEGGDPSVRAAMERYLALEPNAARLGTVVLTTNYLVRGERNDLVNDALLPGARLTLGYADRRATGAPYVCKAWLRLTGRSQSVHCKGEALVIAGRLAPALSGDIDPFQG